MSSRSSLEEVKHVFDKSATAAAGVEKSSWENSTINRTIMDYRSQAGSVTVEAVFLKTILLDAICLTLGQLEV